MTEKIPEDFTPLINEPKISKHVFVQAPESSEEPRDGQTALILYKCRTKDYEVIDSNQNKDSPFSFDIGKPGVIDGLNKGIKEMRIGEKAVLRIPPEFAYGENGSGKIGKNEEIFFELEVLDFKDS